MQLAYDSDRAIGWQVLEPHRGSLESILDTSMNVPALTIFWIHPFSLFYLKLLESTFFVGNIISQQYAAVVLV